MSLLLEELVDCAVVKTQSSFSWNSHVLSKLRDNGIGLVLRIFHHLSRETGKQLYDSGTLSSQVGSHTDKGPRSDRRSDREGCRWALRRDAPSSRLDRNKHWGVGRYLHSDTGIDRQLCRQEVMSRFHSLGKHSLGSPPTCIHCNMSRWSCPHTDNVRLGQSHFPRELVDHMRFFHIWHSSASTSRRGGR